MSLALLVIINNTIAFFFNDPATTEIYTLSLHDALPIWDEDGDEVTDADEVERLAEIASKSFADFESSDLDEQTLRSEEHTSELQSRVDLVCRLLLEKKKK